jgi:hypothetical protein
VDYPDTVDPAWNGVVVAEDKASLLAALEAAEAGDIVYVADDAVIDLSGESPCVGEGVWLAGGRGRGGATAGGLLMTSTTEFRAPIVRACGDDVRITGLRIFGADPGRCPPTWPDQCSGEDRTGGRNCRDCEVAGQGVGVRGVDRFEIDNCELAGWSHAAVELRDTVDAWVHHNDFHHNQRDGLGYGVVLMRGGRGRVSVDIDGNRFSRVRHAVAGSGEAGQDYIAHNNLVLPPISGHVFDMHGENEGRRNGSELAGGSMRVHGNAVLTDTRYAFVVRGRPATGAWFYDNCLRHADANDAALQRLFFGNFHVDAAPEGPAPNDYDRVPDDCVPQRWCFSAGAAAPLRYGQRSRVRREDLGVADIDGDGIDDVFRSGAGSFHWSRSGLEPWQGLLESDVRAGELHFGDFDGDGTDDVFHAIGARWRVSAGGSADWRTLRNAPERLDDLRFGDLDGDGIEDVLGWADGRFRWSRGGSVPWEDVSGVVGPLHNLGFGHFDDDDRIDLVRQFDDAWHYMSAGQGDWIRLGPSGVSLGSLILADLDGDGRTDAYRRNGDRWLVSWGMRTAWKILRIDTNDPEARWLGDFDGDGAVDLLEVGCH